MEIKELVKAGYTSDILQENGTQICLTYILKKRNSHYKSLQDTSKLEEACSALEKIASSGRKLFVATKNKLKILLPSVQKKSKCPTLQSVGQEVC